MRLLLIEDDTSIADVIRRGLARGGMSVEIADDGEMGLEMGERGDYDLVILDLKLPKVDGITVCRTLRLHGVVTPILMLTAHGTSNDMSVAYSNGADDYIVKPFDFDDLISRIRLLVRSSDDEISTVVEAGNLVIDLTRRVITNGERRLHVSDMEFALLECLLKRRGEIVTNEALQAALGGMKIDPRSTMIDTLIGLLSRNLGSPNLPSPIETVNAEGYRFVS